MNNNKNIKNVIDARLSKLSINQELENKILNSSCNTTKSKRRSLAIAASICLFFMVSVPIMAATIPSFNHLLYLISPATAQFLQPIQMVTENNGIKMEVVAAMNDDETAIVYLTLQDLVGNRIDKTVDLYNYSIRGTSSLTHELVNYNEDTKTATFRMIANGGNKLNGKKLTIQVDSFLSGTEPFNKVDTGIILADITSTPSKTIPLNWDNISGGGGDLYAELRKEGTLNILKPYQTNITLPNIDFVHLSNIGYVDGKLHVQTKWPDNIDDHGYLYLTTPTDDHIYPSNVSFGIDENGTPKYGSEYSEKIFEVDQSLISNYSLYGHFIKNSNYTEGKWQTTFKIKSVNKSKKIASNINLDNVKIDNIAITPIGINIESNISDFDDIKIEITMNNGSILSYDQRVMRTANGKSTAKYLLSSPIEIENIKEVRINDNVVNFN